MSAEDDFLQGYNAVKDAQALKQKQDDAMKRRLQMLQGDYNSVRDFSQPGVIGVDSPPSMTKPIKGVIS